MAVTFTTLERVKRFLSIQAQDTTHDALLDDLIATATGEFEVYLDRWVERKERTELFSPDAGARSVGLRGYPVTAVSLVEEDLFGKFEGAQLVVDSSTWRFDPETGILWFYDYAPSGGPVSIRVTYTGGFAATTSEAVLSYRDMAGACDMHVAFLFKRRDNLGFSSIGGEGIQSQASDEVNWLPRVREVLDLRRRVAIA